MILYQFGFICKKFSGFQWLETRLFIYFLIAGDPPYLQFVINIQNSPIDYFITLLLGCKAFDLATLTLQWNRPAEFP